MRMSVILYLSITCDYLVANFTYRKVNFTAATRQFHSLKANFTS